MNVAVVAVGSAVLVGPTPDPTPATVTCQSTPGTR
jgi:hypothetical protein